MDRSIPRRLSDSVGCLSLCDGAGASERGSLWEVGTDISVCTAIRPIPDCSYMDSYVLISATASYLASMVDDERLTRSRGRAAAPLGTAAACQEAVTGNKVAVQQ